MLCGIFGHNWPQYFHESGSIVPDGINRHHMRMHRKCMNCGDEQTAWVHIPQRYVEALDKVEREKF